MSTDYVRKTFTALLNDFRDGQIPRSIPPAFMRNVIGTVRDRSVAHVNDFGTIVGNGSTNDAPTIQAAINAIGAAGGGTLLLPPVTMGVSTPLVMNTNNVILQGEGKKKTRIRAIGNGTKCLSLGTLTTSSSGKVSDCSIRDIGFENTGSSTVETVEVYGVTLAIIENCEFFRGENALVVRNADQCIFRNNIYRVSALGKTALRLIQGSADDVTTCAFLGGRIEVTSSDSTCILFDAGSGTSSNEFNNIVFGDGLKIDGNNLSNNTGVRAIAGMRNVSFRNAELKDFTGYSFDLATALLGGQKVYLKVDSCKVLGNSSSPTLAHFYVKRAPESGSACRINVVNSQVHRAVNGFLSQGGSPKVITDMLDFSSITNAYEVETGAFMRFARGDHEGTVTNMTGANLAASLIANTSIEKLMDSLF